MRVRMTAPVVLAQQAAEAAAEDPLAQHVLVSEQGARLLTNEGAKEYELRVGSTKAKEARARKALAAHEATRTWAVDGFAEARRGGLRRRTWRTGASGATGTCCCRG